MRHKDAFTQAARYIPGRPAAGHSGLPSVARGYTEIACRDGKLRIYAERLVIGPGGERVIEKGKVEIVR